MPLRSSFFRTTLVRAFALAGLAAACLTFAAPIVVADEVAIAPEAMPAVADEALRVGQDLESRGLWADAVSHYEQALREHPGDRRLEQRFDFARLHHGLQRRYADASYLEVLRSTGPQSALDLYGELLAKIESHYVVSPPWSMLVQRGANALLIAASDDEFRRRNGLRASQDQIQAFRQEALDQLSAYGAVKSAEAARRWCGHLTRLAEVRLGAPRSAWVLEFSAATIGGLDNYSTFLTPGQLRDVYSQIEGNFVGLGVELKADSGALLIVRVIPGSPAERSGIGPGDRITAVDGQSTAELSTDEAAALLTGPEGSIARVTVSRAAVLNDTTGGFRPPSLAGLESEQRIVAKPVTEVTTSTATTQAPQTGTISEVIQVRREHVEVPSLEGAKIIDADYGVAYAKIPVFQKTTSRDLDAALWELHRQGMRSLVLDLRGNPGGLLTASVELADKFVSQGNLVSTRGRSEGEDFDYRAHRSGTWRVPLVVLIDGDSASASEIFAAAIRDNRRGTIVGSRSFGKGSVQGIFPMSIAGAGVRLTTAKFFSPKGRPISKVGVNPDIVVRHATSVAGGQGESQTVGYRGAQPDDPVLQRAVETAREQVAMR